jgi:maleylacetoacetate isomerase
MYLTSKAREQKVHFNTSLRYRNSTPAHSDFCTDNSPSMTTQTKYRYVLYSYFRSSCSARIRIAAHLKDIALEYKYIHLVKGEQHSKEYHGLNPSDSVPTLLVLDAGSGKEIARIRQSTAILEFFEEVESGVKLLPEDVLQRAKVRELLSIIASDVQPVTNLRVLNFIKPRGIAADEWQQHFMKLGFQAYEELLTTNGGKFSVGDSLSFADCALAPAVDGALRFGVPVESEFPRVWKVWKELSELKAFKDGRWNSQADTPDELKRHG